MRELERTLHPVFEAYAESTSAPIGLAVSGGGDSLALLYLASQWAKQTGRTLFCLTVDHGLRAEAADEARCVGKHCDKLGLSHRILKWNPGEGHIGQARSRRARHVLLAEAAREAGGDLILMGHTKDDQAETLVMRGARETRGYGLAGIRSLAVSPVWPEGRGVNIGRPLLGTRREELRGYLRAHQVSWVDDPSNLDPRYERVRTRDVLEQADRQGGEDDSPLLKAALFAGEARERCDQRLAPWFREGVDISDDGLIRFDPLLLDTFELDQDRLAEGLAWLLMCVAGHDRRPNRESRLALAGDILADPHGFQARTLGGAWIAPRKKQVTLARDPGRVAAMPQRVEAGQIWDGRFLFLPRQSGQNNANMTSNPSKTVELTDIAAMARETYPLIARDKFEVIFLARQRLNQIAFMFDYDNLINQSAKNGLSPSLRKD